MGRRKIPLDELREGMVVDLGTLPWFDHPFLSSRRCISSTADVDLLRKSGLTEVDIEVPEEEHWEGLAEGLAEGQAKEPVEMVPADTDADELSDHPPARPIPPEGVPFEEEILAARKIHSEAKAVVRGVLGDVRLGRNIRSGAVKRLVGEMVDSIFRNPYALSSLARLKGYDEYTFVHSLSVCILCIAVGRHMGFNREDLEMLGLGALLHDAGKMLIPLPVLNKKGALTQEETVEVRQHPLRGLDILAKSPGIPEAARDVVLQHHERYDGSGYPSGLKGEEISRFAQIAAIIDVYDAVTTDRCYKDGVTPTEGLREIYAAGRNGFNLDFVERFIQCLGIYPVGTLVQLDTREIGIVCSINSGRVLRPRVLLLLREPGRPYRPPIVADLEEAAPDRQGYRRTIVKPVDPKSFGLSVDDHLAAIMP